MRTIEPVPGRLISETYGALFEKKGAKPKPSWWCFGWRKEKYEYGKELGYGSFGVVYSARMHHWARLPAKLASLREDDLDSAQLGWLQELSEARDMKERSFQCAAKVLFKNTKNGPGRVEREVRMLRLCRGRRVLLLVDHFETKLAHHVITQRCYGAGDKRLLDEARPEFAARRARKWTAQLLRAIAHVHAQGVIHRDVKPSNLLCTSSRFLSDIVLGDFGMAKMVDMEGRAITAGSWGYWNPPAFDGFMTQDSDLWAVGVSALELCGTRLETASRRSIVDETSMCDDPKLGFQAELNLGLAEKTVKTTGLADDAGLRPFLGAVFAASRPTRAQLLALLPEVGTLLEERNGWL